MNAVIEQKVEAVGCAVIGQYATNLQQQDQAA
jgi:hypothetical protein